MEKEIWKDVPSLIGYQASNMGRVRSLDRLSVNGRRLKGKILNQHRGTNGYLHVGITNHSHKSVHVLVAMAFLDHVPCGHKLIVDHYPDKDVNNNKLSNIRIATTRENHSSRPNTSSKYVGVTWYGKTNRWRATIRINGKQVHLGTFTKEIDAHNAYQKKLKEISK